MPKVKGGEAALADTPNLTFEGALKKLETIVESLEAHDLPLEELLARYEEGMRLSQHCQAKLAEADLKIQQLEQGSKGEMTLSPISLPAETL
ncbi:MAG TPA: exodeoxyribonuclease VII small subunit [Candidatus Saccharimonadales bacterium]|nr:exodeoxyribonuclease VII small subunit [Candidatus Saccharimonadales bacterium]